MASSTSTMGKRVSAWLLVLVMLLSLLPTAALAADEEAPAQETAEPADTAEPAEPAEPDGAELLEIITPGDAVPVNAPTGTGTSEDPFLVSSEEELRTAVSAGPADGTPNHIRLADNVTVTGRQLVIDKTLTLDLNGKTLKVSQYTAKAAQMYVTGALTLEDSSAEKTGTICSDYTGTAGLVVSVDGSGSLTMNGGTITTDGMANAGNALKIGKGGSVTFNGGAIRCGAKRGNRAVNVSGTFIMNGGSVLADRGDGTETFITAINGNSGSAISIVGGTVEGPTAVTARNSNISIRSGSFTGSVEVKKKSISGGTFSEEVKKEYCADGYTLTRQADGTYSVKETVYEASIGETKYETFAEAVAAVADGGTITLLQDVTVGSPVAVNGKSILLDLNGKTVTGINTDTNSVFTVYSDSGLTLMNGTVAASNSGGAITTRGTVMLQSVAVKGSAKGMALISVNTGAKVTVDANSSVVTMDGANYPAIILNRNEDGGVKTLDVYGKVAATGWPGIQGNGADQDTSYVNIYSSASVTSNKLAMYLPQKCIVNVSGTVSGYCGIGIKSGTLNISGGLVQGTEKDNLIGDQYSTTDGINFDGSAILVDSYIGYAGNVKINITGGKVQSLYSTAIREIGNDASKTLMVSLNVSGGEVYGASGAEAIAVRSTTRKTVSISGGTFSSPVEKEYCTEGYEPVINTDGTYGVGQVYRPVEVWTSYSGEKVASYSTAAEAAAHLGVNKWIVITADYTLEADFTIPEGVFMDVAAGATFTVPDGVTLTVAANAKRFGVRTGGTAVNNGTILVCGTTYSKGYVLLQSGATLDTTTISVPDGYFLTHNNTNYYAAIATFKITYADKTTGMAGDQPTSTELAGAVKLTLLRDLSDFALSFGPTDHLGENFVFDLGGHTLSGGDDASAPVLTISAPMTIQNGTIEYKSTANNGAIRTSGDITVASNLVIRGGKGYGVWTEGYGHTLTVNGTVQSDGSYAITGNGSVNSGYVDECNIVVNNGAKIEAPNGIGIYHPQLGTVTINGGEISGKTGVQLCAGKLSMTAGSITSTGDNYDASGSQNAISDGAAISLVSRGYPGGDPSAEISGGTVKATGAGALAVKAYDYSGDTVSEWTKAGDNIQISGGTFSTPVKKEYCAESYEPKENADGTHTVAQKPAPTATPTPEPTATPTLEPSATPTPTPTQKPTPKPTQKPTPKPTSSTWYPTYTTPAPVKSSAIPVTVKGTQFTVNGAAKQESFTGSYAKLATVTVKYTGSEEFVCWVNASGNIVTTEKSFRLTVVGKTELTAITCGKDRKSGETLLVYENAAENGQLVHTETVTAESVASEKFAFPAAAVMPGREFTYWTVEIGGERVEATADVLKAQIESGAKALILAPEYEAAGTYRVQLLCTDEAGAELQTPVVYTGMETGMLKYVTAPDISGYTFSCWKDETGRAVGTNRKYAAFSADADALVTLTAVYVPAGQTAAKNESCVTLSLTDAAKTDGAGTISFAAIFSVPDNRTVVKRGFLYTDNSRKTLTCEKAEDLKTFEWDSETENCGRMVVTLGLKDTLCAVYVRAFAVLDDGTVVYSDMVSYSVDTAIDAAEMAADAELPKDNAETVETEGDAFCDAGSVTTKW